MKVCFFLDNPYSMDTRIIKECESLYELGCDVSVICYWRKGFPEGLTIENGIKVYRLKKGFANIAHNINLVKRHVTPEYKQKLTKLYNFFNQTTSKIQYIKKCISKAKNAIVNSKKYAPRLLAYVCKKIFALFTTGIKYVGGLLYYFLKSISPNSLYHIFKKLVPVSLFRLFKRVSIKFGTKLTQQTIEYRVQNLEGSKSYFRIAIYKIISKSWKTISKVSYCSKIILCKVTSYVNKIKNVIAAYAKKVKDETKSFIKITKDIIYIGIRIIISFLTILFNIFYVFFALITVMYFQFFKVLFYTQNNELHNVKKNAVKLRLTDMMILIVQIITLCLGLILSPIIFFTKHLENRSFFFRIKTTPKNNFVAFIKGLKYITVSPTFISNFIVGILLKPDVIQANDPPTILSAFFSGKFINCQLIYDAHEIYDESFPTRKPLLLRFIIRCLEKIMTRHVFQNFTVNNSIAELMQMRYKISNKPKVLRNVQMKNDLYPVRHEALTDLDVFKGYDNKIKLLYAGKLTYGRGIEAIIKAMPYVRADYHLFLMGHCDNQFRRKIDKLIVHHNVENAITIMPSVPSDQVVDICRQADMGLMLTTNMTLSYYYGLGNKIFHYIGSGIPVLVPNQPEKAQLIRDYDVGWVVPKLHQAVIKDVLQRIAKDKLVIKKKKENCIEASKVLIWENEVQNYLDSYIKIYEKILFEDNVYA